MRCGTSTISGVTILVVAVVTSFLPHADCSPSMTGSTERRGGEDMVRRGAVAVVVDGEGEGGDNRPGKSEAELIQPIRIPFKQQPGEWETRGISLTASGEPKSGTTWLARVIVELCLQLCGNRENPWCAMGGLTVLDTPPAPRYDFEMLHAETGELFLHFKGKMKHEIPGLEMEGSCSRGGRPHPNSFGGGYPCNVMYPITRDALTACLPDTSSPACIQHLPPLDPVVKRMAVIFRDARNLVISEHRMRVEVYHQDAAELEPFIRIRFQTILAWIHQRWVWHTTALKHISHVMFYEDLQAHPHHLTALAAFVGLDCTAEEADDVWQRHTYANPPGDYTTYGLSVQTLEWMNATMARILPEAMLDRYELTPIYT